MAIDGDGEANHRRLDEQLREETEPLVHPGHVDLLEELPEEMTFSQPYEGARYELTECTDFSKEHLVPSGVKDPFGRFAGIKYQGFEDILIMGPKYGDQRAEWGKTRDECRRAAVYAAIAHESWEEIVHNNVPLGSGAEESGLGGAECYAVAEDQPVIFGDFFFALFLAGTRRKKDEGWSRTMVETRAG